MLDSMRSLAKTPIAKLLLIVLGVSFGVWGVSGIVTHSSDSAIAHVGKFSVTQADFRRVFDRQVEAMRRQFGDSFNASQARMFGVDREVLQGLIAGASLDEAARRLGLATPDDAIIAETRKTQAFFGPDGRFSQPRFVEILRRSGYNEASYFEAMRRDMTRAQLQDTISEGFATPTAMARPLYEFQGERRVARYIVITPDAIDPPAAPAQDAIKAYYEAHKAQYRTPEYRRFSYVILDPNALAKTITVDEDKAREYFEFHKDEFGRPEKRTIEQIVFPSEDAAAAARTAIGGGKSFLDAAKDAGFTAADIALGERTARDLPEPVAKAAFALDKDAVSAPVKTDFGWSLLRVTAIAAGQDASFADARATVETQLAKDAATEKIYDLGNTLEDKREAGQSLEAAAGPLGLEVHVIDSSDPQGRRPDGTPIAALDGQKELLTQAFSAEQGAESEMIPTAGGGYVALRVDAITPPKDQSLDEVADKVRETLLAQAGDKAVDAKTITVLSRAKAGTSLDALANELGRVVQTSDPIPRGASNETFSADAVASLFQTAKGDFASGSVGLGESRLVMQVVDIQRPDVESFNRDLPQLRQELSSLFGNEALQVYAKQAEVTAKVKYNEAVLQSVLGAGDEAATP